MRGPATDAGVESLAPITLPESLIAGGYSAAVATVGKSDKGMSPGLQPLS